RAPVPGWDPPGPRTTRRAPPQGLDRKRDFRAQPTRSTPRVLRLGLDGTTRRTAEVEHASKDGALRASSRRGPASRAALHAEPQSVWRAPHAPNPHAVYLRAQLASQTHDIASAHGAHRERSDQRVHVQRLSRRNPRPRGGWSTRL